MAIMMPWLFALAVGCALAIPLPVSVSVFPNSGLAGAPTITAFAELSLTVPAPPGAAFYSAEVTTQLAAPRGGTHVAFDCATSFSAGVTLGFVWVDDHLICSGANSSSPYALKVSSTDGTTAFPIFVRPGSGRTAWLVRAQLYVNASECGADGPAFALQWCAPAAPGGACAPAPIPAGALTAGLPPGEAQRAALQRALATGWGLWTHDNVLSADLLPAGVRFSLALCDVRRVQCLLAAIPDDGNVRVGLHASDRSVAQFYVGSLGVNVSVTVLGGAELSVLVEVVGGAGAGAGFAIAVTGDMLWRRGGAAASDGLVLRAAPAGLPAVALRAAAAGAVPPVDPSTLDPAVRARPFIAVSLAAGAVALSTAGAPSVPAVRAAAAAAAAAETARYAAYGELAEAAQAVQASIAWTFISTPAEPGPFPPVSRAWSAVRVSPAEADPGQWGYVMFAWDNQLAALLAGLASGKEVAYSSFIQAVRSRTAEGFIPNYSAGGGKSVDRTEPPLAGRVLQTIFAKFKEPWLVDFLLDDLLDNLDWFWRRRRTPAGLICLGSDPVVNYTMEAGSVGAMQGARWESGLDDSPMYDGDWYDNVTHHMEGADVGMSSLFVAEAAAVAALARAVNRTSDADALDARAASVRALIAAHLWDDARGIFTNAFAIGANTSLSARVSPTSFYALLAGAATDAQAARMATEWALNASRFCLSETWPSDVTAACFYGLPSISADDPAFPALGYWRGYVWGPMSQITYWSLAAYAHVPAVAAAKAALARQHGAMFIEQWRRNRNVCENFWPHAATDCSGTPFYSWGALTALLAFEEAGLY